MNFEAGKYYKVRDGRTAFVVAAENPFDPLATYPVLGYCGGYHEAWTKSGSLYAGEEDDGDLISDSDAPEEIELHGKRYRLVPLDSEDD